MAKHRTAAPNGKRRKKVSKADAEHQRRLEILDPRQTRALTLYSDPSSPTFGNLKQSCISAGFSATYADNITNFMPDWLSGFMGQHSIKLAKVERNIDKFLDLETAEHVVGEHGPAYLDAEKTKPLMKENPRMLELQLKMTQFVAERLDRKNYGKDDKVNIGFSFNIRPVKERYSK